MVDGVPEVPRAVRGPDAFSYLFAGFLLLILGVYLLALNLGMLGLREALSQLFFCLFILFVADAAVRFRAPWTRHRGLVYGVLGGLFLTLSFVFRLGAERWWPLILVFSSVALLLWAFMGFRRRKPLKQADESLNEAFS